MKIAVVSMIRSPWGGSEELWAALATQALKEGHQVFLSAYDCGEVHPKMQQLMELGLKVTYRKKVTGAHAGPFRKLMVLGYYFILHRLQGAFHKILKHQPDIVLYNGTCYSIANDKRLLQELPEHTRLFIIAHYNPDFGNPLTGQESRVVNEAYARAEKVFFVSQRNLETARRHWCSDIPNAALVRNPVNMKSTGLVTFPAGEVAQLAMVGNLLTVHKGQDIAIAALATEQWRQRLWHLNIYGSGADENYLRSLCAYYGLQDKVSFHGRVDDIRALWAQNHLLLMPSLMEGMPLAVVEAMLCGRPCVVTDVGGHKEWITEPKEGFIAEAPSVASFAAAMERAWTEQHRWQEMGMAAHQKASSLYDPDPGGALLKLILESRKQ